MSLTFNTDGDFAGQTIRVTPDKYASIYDVMKVAGVGREATHAWNDLKAKFCSVSLTSGEPQVKTYKFPGRGQRDTPVINGQGLVRLLFLLPGVKARQFVAESAETLVRYIGGDESLIDEIRHNREIATNEPQSTQAFMAANVTIDNGSASLALAERKCKLERDQEDVKRIKLENLEAYQRFALDNITDPRVRELVQNEVVNQVVHHINPELNEQLCLQDSHSPQQGLLGNSSYITIDQVATESMGLKLTTKEKCCIGRNVARLFRQQYPDEHIPTVEKYVNGEMRQVKVYPREFEEHIQSYVRDSRIMTST